MKAIGNKQSEDIRVKSIVLFIFISLLYPQFQAEHLIHPLEDSYKSIIDSTTSYIQLDSRNHIDIPGMISSYDNTLTYKTNVNGIGVNIAYQNFHSEINSDTMSTLFKLNLRKKYQSYNIDIHKKYNTWIAGLGYSMNHASDTYNNINAYISRDIGNNANFEYKYTLQTIPTYFTLEYEDFKYTTNNNQQNEIASLLYSYTTNSIASSFQFEKSTYSKPLKDNFDLIQGGNRSTKMDVSVQLDKNITIYSNWMSSLDTMTANFLKDVK